MDTKENKETRESIPQGAIWVKNYKLRQSVMNFISTRDVECTKCHNHFQADLTPREEQELNDTIINQVMIVKITTLREKFIALCNPRKSLSYHPDYFVYCYQAYTGAPKVYPFTTTTTKTAQGTADSYRHCSPVQTGNSQTGI